MKKGLMKKNTRPAIRPNRHIWDHGNSFKDAALLCCEQGLPQPMAVNAALAIELYLKSFLALNVLTEKSTNMGFSSEHGHVFTELLKKLEASDEKLLFEELAQINPSIEWKELFKKYDDTFIKVRYWYESGNGKPIDSDIVDFAENLGNAVLNVGKIKHT